MSQCKITGKVLSVQLGRESTQILLVGKGAELVYGLTVDTPAGAVEDGMIQNPDLVRDMLKAALRQPEFKGVHQVVFSLCTSQVVSDTEYIPNVPANRIEKLLQTNMDTYFPVDMKEYQLVWQVVGPKMRVNGLKELAVQLWAVPRAMLTRYYVVANACGLSVAGIDYCGHSIAGAVGASFAKPGKERKLNLNTELTFGHKKAEEEHTPEPEPAEEPGAEQTTLHVTLEKDFIGMTFVQAGQVVYQRIILCGADPSYQFSEVAMQLEYFRTMELARGSRVCGVVSGAYANDRHLTDELADFLGMELQCFEAGYEPQWLLCVGAAATALDFGIPALNKPGKAHSTGGLHSQVWQLAVVIAGGAALAGVVTVTMSSRVIWNSSIDRLESTRQTLTVQAQKTAGYADNYKEYSALYDNYYADWETVFASLRTYNDNLVLVLEELEETLPKKASVTGLQIAEDGLTVQFACETKEVAAYLIMELRKLQYADLTSISNLTGGGAGPAKTYGGPAKEKEPTEGSSYQLKDYLNETDAANALLTLYLPNRTAYDAVKSAYGVTPAAGSFDGSVAEVYLREMLVNNPFAATGFYEVLRRDVENFQSSFQGTYETDFYVELYQLHGSISSSGINVTVIGKLVDILSENDERLAATTSLIKTDPTLTSWYAYYLNNGVDAALPYLQLDKLQADLDANGSANTGNDAANSALNKLASGYLAAINPAPTPTPNPADLHLGYTKAEWQENVVVYLTQNGELGDNETANTAEAVLAKYLTTGDSGNAAINGILDARLKDQTVKVANAVSEVWYRYVQGNSNTGNPTFNQICVNYQNNTGNAALNSLLAVHIGGVSASTPTPTPTPGPTAAPGVDWEALLAGMDIPALLDQYIAYGKTDNELFDKVAKDYLEKGTTGLGKEADALVEKKLSEYLASDKWEKWLFQYLLMGTTDSSVLNNILKKYQSDGTTGVSLLDKQLGGLLGTGGLGSTSPDGSDAPTDTRIFFTVTLGYKQSLKEAELARKGLSYSDRVAKLEVENG